MSHCENERNPVEVLADEFAAALRNGHCPSVSSYIRRCPEHATEIGELFPSIALMEKLSRRDQNELVSAKRRAMLQTRPIQQLGDYQIVRAIGRGGMGVVYEAIQESLARRVAVKVLTTTALSTPRQLRRFRREARAAASLHHTNIVPIFGVGEADGLHYYVMQLIDGVGLDRLIQDQRTASDTASGNTADTYDDGRPQPVVSVTPVRIGAGGGSAAPWLRVAAMAAQVARALEHAHGRGVLHCDIKPGNLLLDSQGAVWVTDFGLARLFGDEELSQSYDVAGTVRYMAPEQMEGQPTPSSDVYSLGVTLFELATLRPAFEHSPRSSLMDPTVRCELTPPRTWDPAFPGDLEAIILKAAAHDPAMRYGTAGELADDLQRFVLGEPIAARYTNVGERLLRWSRRNPALATLSGVSAALLATIALITSIAFVRIDAERAKAVSLSQHQKQSVRNARLAKETAEAVGHLARQEHQRAEGNLALAMTAFERVIESVSNRGVVQSLELGLGDEGFHGGQSVITDEDAELLQSLLEFYEQFAAGNGRDNTVPLEAAEAHRHIGDIRQRLGQFSQALAAYTEFLTIYEGLAVKEADRWGYVLARVEVMNQRGVVLAKLGRVREAMQAHLDAKDQLTGQPQSVAGSHECRFALAETYHHLGAMGSSSGFVAPSLDLLGPRWLRGGPRSGGRELHAGPPWVEDYRQTAVAILEELVAERPGSVEYRLALARCNRNLAATAWDASRSREVVARLNKAIEILEQLSSENPHDPRFSFELAEALLTEGPLLEQAELGWRMEERLDRAITIARYLSSVAPQHSEYSALLGSALGRRGALDCRENRFSNAQTLLAEAAAILDKLVERYPLDWTYRVLLGRTLNDLGSVLYDKGHFDASRAILEEGVRRLTHDDARQLVSPSSRQCLTALYVNLARSLHVLREHSLAEGAFHEARELQVVSAQRAGPPFHGPGRRRWDPASLMH